METSQNIHIRGFKYLAVASEENSLAFDAAQADTLRAK
jgi:hypothetical protein